jgi:hypothetical protein
MLEGHFLVRNLFEECLAIAQTIRRMQLIE